MILQAQGTEKSAHAAGPTEAQVRDVLAMQYERSGNKWVSVLRIEVDINPREFHADPYATALRVLSMYDSLAGSAIAELHKRLLKLSGMN